MTTAVTTAIILCAAFAAFMYFRRKRVVILQPHLAFPDDENGDVLRLMQANGDDLDAPRDINFAFLFETQSEAERFAAVVAAPNFLVETFGGFRHYYFCVAPDIDLASIIQPVAQRYPPEKLTWKYSAKPGRDFLRWYAEQDSTAISPPVSFQT